MALDLPTSRVSRCDFRQTELGIVRCDDEVAHHGQLAASTQCIARDRGDQWFAASGNAIPLCQVVALENVRMGQGCHLANVGAGGEGPFGAGDDDAADAIIRLQTIQGDQQLGGQQTR
jgi:hypothetical protein